MVPFVRRAAAIAPLLALAVCVTPVRAERPASPPAEAVSRVSNYRPEIDRTARHPLKAVIDYASREQQYLEQTVRDFTCRLVKRERINGYLQDTHFIDMEVREQPLSLYLYFLGPKNVIGRKVIYVDGQNNGEMLVRNGGKHFDYVTANLDPNGETAKEETLVPVTEIGFNRLLAHMIGVLRKHEQIDAAGQNSKAERISGAKINGRTCTVIRIIHPEKMSGLEFHQANVFVDNELNVPIRVDYSDWPTAPGRPAPLIAEYTYTDLKLNVGLNDGSFDRSRLRGAGE